MKKMPAILMAILACLTLPAMAEVTYTIGICQLVQHASLDSATQGFQNALTELLGNAGIFSGCGIATICIDHYDLCHATGKMAYEILVNRADVAAMPVEFSPNPTKVCNPGLCELLSITIPEGYEALS